MYTDFSTQVEFLTSTGTFSTAWRPTITTVATTLAHGSKNNSISGTQFNGLSQANAYGDDFQDATNYPLVRITNNATGHAFYCKTHGHSTMGVATGAAIVSTKFDVPSGIETGASKLVVVANGIPSVSVAVIVNSHEYVVSSLAAKGPSPRLRGLGLLPSVETSRPSELGTHTYSLDAVMCRKVLNTSGIVKCQKRDHPPPCGPAKSRLTFRTTS